MTNDELEIIKAQVCIAESEREAAINKGLELLNKLRGLRVTWKEYGEKTARCGIVAGAVWDHIHGAGYIAVIEDDGGLRMAWILAIKLEETTE